MNRFNWIKLHTLELGFKLKDLSEKSGYSYDYFIQVLNGFKRPPQDFVDRVNGVFKIWENDVLKRTSEG